LTYHQNEKINTRLVKENKIKSKRKRIKKEK
jgi:hypothetical protein